MKYIKRFLICVALLILALSVFVYVGSIDTDEVNDQGLSNGGVAVSDAENGFTIIEYIVKDDFIFLDGEQRNQLKSKIASRSWDRVYAEGMIATHLKAIEDFSRVTEYHYIQFPKAENALQLPPYNPVMDMARLALLKSRYLAEMGQLDEAVALTDKVIHLAVQIKAQPDENLLTHMISLAMQYEALHWLNQLAHGYSVDHDQLKALLTIVADMPTYENDGFREVFAGEYRYSMLLTAEMVDPPLNERWALYRSKEDYSSMDVDGDSESGRVDIKQELLSFLATIFPKFYAHPRRGQNLLAERHKILADKSALYCSELTASVPTMGDTGLTWLALVTPNSIIKQWYSNFGQEYYDYFYRRCFTHAHMEATKALIALRMYQREHGEYPGTLEALRPQYLDSLPVDPFDGSAIRYSKEDAWVYSVGRNFEDDGGSVSGYYSYQCRANDDCKNNPTFPLDAHACVDPDPVNSETCKSTEQVQEEAVE